MVDFKETFEREERQIQLKCRFHADLQTKVVRECSAFESYERCLSLVNQINNFSKDLNNNMAFQIVVFLCPLNAIENPKCGVIHFHDVNVHQVARSFRVWDKLDNFRTKTDSFRSAVKVEYLTRLCRFVDVVGKYQNLLKKSMKEAVVEARKNRKSFSKVVADVAENHILYRPPRLKRWLYYEQAEIEMAEKILTGVDGISFLTDGQRRNQRLVSDKNCVLIVLVPGLIEMKYDILWTMEDYMEAGIKHLESVDLDSDEDYDEDGDTTEDEEEKYGISFRTVEFKKKFIQSKAKVLSKHIGRNEGIEDQVQFFVTDDRDKGFKCCNLLYDFTNEENPMKTFWFKFPIPPTNVRSRVEVNGRTRRSKLSSLSIRVEWDNNQDKWCHFFGRTPSPGQ